MYKIFLIAIFIFSGCSNVTFNATLCEQIASEPGATVPRECIEYSEEEAAKAFNKKASQQSSSDEIIEFNKE